MATSKVKILSCIDLPPGRRNAMIELVRRLFREGVFEVYVDYRAGVAYRVRWRVPGRDEMRSRLLDLKRVA